MTLRAWVDGALGQTKRPLLTRDLLTREPTICDAPLDAYVHGIGTDVEFDLKPLWQLTVAAYPRVVLELGTRHAISTRTLAHACQRVGAVLFTCDPDPTCAAFLRGVPAVAFRCTFERLTELRLFPPGSVDVLFIDVDPHSFEQTTRVLDSFVAETLASAGIALFHDVNARDVSGAPRPDIQVKAAIENWVFQRNDDAGRGIRFGDRCVVWWDYVELGHDGVGGLGVLRRRG